MIAPLRRNRHSDVECVVEFGWKRQCLVAGDEEVLDLRDDEDDGDDDDADADANADDAIVAIGESDTGASTSTRLDDTMAGPVLCNANTGDAYIDDGGNDANSTVDGGDVFDFGRENDVSYSVNTQCDATGHLPAM